MGGKKTDERTSKDKKRSFFKSIFGHNTSSTSLSTNSPPADSPLSLGPKPTYGSQRPQSFQPGKPNIRRTDEFNAPPQDSVRPGKWNLSQPLPSEFDRGIHKSRSHGELVPSEDSGRVSRGPSTKSEPPPGLMEGARPLGLPVLVHSGKDDSGVSLQLYFEEHCPSVPSPPSSSPTTPIANTHTPVLRIAATSTRLNGILRITNTRRDFVSSRLTIVLFTGQGRTGLSVMDPEAPSAAGLHTRPIARSAAYVWKEPVQVGVGTHDFPFTLPLSTGLPQTLQTFSPGHANRLDVSHVLFVKLRRSEQPHMVCRTDLGIQRCAPEDRRVVSERRMRTETGVIANGLIMFRAEAVDICDVDNPFMEAHFQATRSSAPDNCVIIEAVECQWREKIFMRSSGPGNFTRLDRPLHTPLRRNLSHSAPDALLRFTPSLSVMAQPDGDFDSIKVSHELTFTVDYFTTPLDVEPKKEMVILPARFLALFGKPTDTTPVNHFLQERMNAQGPSMGLQILPASVQDQASGGMDLDRGMQQLSIAPPVSLPLPVMSQPQTLRSQPVAGEQYRSQHSFPATEVDEITLSEGDVVLIWESFDDGWASGQNLTTSASGFFPLNALGEDAWKKSEAFAAGLLAPPLENGGKLTVCRRKTSKYSNPLRQADLFGGSEANAEYERLRAGKPRGGLDSGVSQLGESAQRHKSDLIAPSAEIPSSRETPGLQISVPNSSQAYSSVPSTFYEPPYQPTSTYSSASTPYAQQSAAYADPIHPSNPPVLDPRLRPMSSIAALPPWDAATRTDPGTSIPRQRPRTPKGPRGPAPLRSFSLDDMEEDSKDEQSKQEPAMLSSSIPTSAFSHNAAGSGGMGNTGDVRPKFQVVRGFVPQQKGQVEVRYGNVVVIEESYANGWCLGTNLATGQRGRFPTSALDIQPRSSTPLAPVSDPSYTVGYGYGQSGMGYSYAPAYVAPQIPAAAGYAGAGTPQPSVGASRPVEGNSLQQQMMKKLDEDLLKGQLDPRDYLARRDEIMRMGIAH
ncbi:hypothetical protein SpCBS45565_g01064 [Spizellomyces sp. 'palustris']|nr:hypothetical protein SpCBS45565_g01064 [Spizellomyces sp. 'palustris']